MSLDSILTPFGVLQGMTDIFAQNLCLSMTRTSKLCTCVCGHGRTCPGITDARASNYMMIPEQNPILSILSF